MSEKKTKAATYDHLLIAPLARLTVGETFMKVPPHLTVLPWFRLEDNVWEEFDGAMEELVVQESFFAVHGGESDNFGTLGEVRVRKLAGGLLGVHFHALAVVKALGELQDSQFTGMGYAPHVTDSQLGSVAQDESLTLSQLTVIKRGNEQGIKTVKQVYELRP